jgi:hypothetical protein
MPGFVEHMPATHALIIIVCNYSATVCNDEALSWQLIHTIKNKLFLPDKMLMKSTNTGGEI